MTASTKKGGPLSLDRGWSRLPISPDESRAEKRDLVLSHRIMVFSPGKYRKGGTA